MKRHSSWLTVAIAPMLFCFGVCQIHTSAVTHSDQEKHTDMNNKQVPIKYNCRFLREQDLATMLGMPRQEFENEMVYVVGYFQNDTREMGFVAAEISLETELVLGKGGTPIQIFRRVIVDESFISPMNKGHLFIAKLDRVDLRCKVEAIQPKVAITKVYFK